MNRHLQVWVAIGLAIVASLLVNSKALAHAFLIRTVPEQNAVLLQPPEEIHLWFSESVSAEFSTVELIRANGEAVAGTQLLSNSANPDQIVAKLPPLPDDVYTVHWQILSDSDLHTAQGTVIFRVGAGSAQEASPTEVQEELPPGAEVLLRWLNFGILAAIAGMVLIVYGVLRDNGDTSELSQLRADAQVRLLRMGTWYALAALLVGVCLLGWHIYAWVGSLPTSLSPAAVGWRLLSTTSWGLLWLMREVTLLVFLIFIGTLNMSPGNMRPIWEPVVFGSLVVCLVISQAMSGHAAGAAANAPLDIAVDSLHLLAAGIWAGGLLNLLVGVVPILPRDATLFSRLARSTIAPFSRFALFSVAILAATGLYSVGQQVTTLDALISTNYGKALLAKSGLVIIAGGFGLFNSLLIHPRLANGWKQLSFRRVSDHIRHLPRSMTLECISGILVLLFVGFLTASYPARADDYSSAASGVPTTLNQVNGDLLVAFSASPNQPGTNVFQVLAISTRRPAPAKVGRVIVRFTYLGNEADPIAVDAVEESPGFYRLSGDYLSLAGPYQVDVIVRREGLSDVVAHFDWTVAPAQVSRTVILSDKPLEPLLSKAASLGLLAIALTGIAWRYLAKPTKDSVIRAADAAIRSATTIGNKS